MKKILFVALLSFSAFAFAAESPPSSPGFKVNLIEVQKNGEDKVFGTTTVEQPLTNKEEVVFQVSKVSEYIASCDIRKNWFGKKVGFTPSKVEDGLKVSARKIDNESVSSDAEVFYKVDSSVLVSMKSFNDPNGCRIDLPELNTKVFTGTLNKTHSVMRHKISETTFVELTLL